MTCNIVYTNYCPTCAQVKQIKRINVCKCRESRILSAPCCLYTTPFRHIYDNNNSGSSRRIIHNAMASGKQFKRRYEIRLVSSDHLVTHVILMYFINIDQRSNPTLLTGTYLLIDYGCFIKILLKIIHELFKNIWSCKSVM